MADSGRRVVLHLDCGRELRGGQWQVIRLMRGLRMRGHDNLLLAPANSPLLEQMIREDFKCDAIAVSSIMWASRLAEIVHAHDARSHSLAALWSRRPLVVSRRVAFPVKRNPLSRWKYSRPDMFAAVSEVAASELRRAGVPAEKIWIVHDGVPILPNLWERNGPVVFPHSTDPNKVGTLAGEVAATGDFPVVSSGNLEADLEGAGALVYLTSSEGLGSAALLAMSAGVPVIASDVGGLREVIENDVTGMLVPNETQAILAAIRRLRESPELARQFSENSRARVAEKFSESCMVSQTLALYCDILKS